MCAHYAYAKSAGADSTLASAIAEKERAIKAMLEARKKAKVAGQIQIPTPQLSSGKGSGRKNSSVSSKRGEKEQIKTNARAKNCSVTSARMAASNVSEHTSGASSPKKRPASEKLSRASAVPKFELAKETKMLIKRQKQKLPSALKKLKRNKRKTEHWAWW